MSPFDLTPGDDPLDVQAVHADDAAVERLRRALSPEGAVVWDDDDDDMDPGYALLRAVQLDVSADLPTEIVLPKGVTELVPRRRHLSRTTTMAVVAAGVLSIGGVAAASAPGQPLAGARQAVSAAVARAVDAITPDAPVGPAVAPATHSPSAKPTPPGDAVSDAARSAAAVRQIQDNLDRAEAFLGEGRTQPAQQQLDAAARKLHYVTDAAERGRLERRLTALQARLATMPTAEPTQRPDDRRNVGKGGGKDGQGSSSGNSGRPDVARTPNPRASSAGRSEGARDAGGKGATAPVSSGPNLPGDSSGMGGAGHIEGTD